MGHREALLVAARRLLEERGYAHITARDLVAASDTNLASIGYHFGSKAALLNAAIEAAFEDWSGKLADFAMSDPDATPMQRAGDDLGRRPAGAARPAADPAVLHRGPGPRRCGVPELREQLAGHYSRARSRVAALVARSIGDGATADDRGCRATASLVIAACDGLAVQWMLDPDDCPTPEELAVGLTAVLDASLLGVAARQRPSEIPRTAGRTSAR